MVHIYDAGFKYIDVPVPPQNKSGAWQGIRILGTMFDN